MLKTWEFGYIRIVAGEDIVSVCDTFIREDVLGEWSYYQLADGEIVAVHNWED